MGRGKGKKTEEERFWAKVEKTEGCWMWTGAKSAFGYGQFGGSQSNIAHRMSYYFAHGELPAGKVICHSCDNPPCVNPDHLFAGTQRDNIMDALRKGRLFIPDSVRTCTHGPNPPLWGRPGRERCSLCGMRNQRTYRAKRRQRARELRQK